MIRPISCLVEFLLNMVEMGTTDFNQTLNGFIVSNKPDNIMKQIPIFIPTLQRRKQKCKDAKISTTRALDRRSPTSHCFNFEGQQVGPVVREAEHSLRLKIVTLVLVIIAVWLWATCLTTLRFCFLERKKKHRIIMHRPSKYFFRLTEENLSLLLRYFPSQFPPA